MLLMIVPEWCSEGKDRNVELNVDTCTPVSTGTIINNISFFTIRHGACSSPVQGYFGTLSNSRTSPENLLKLPKFFSNILKGINKHSSLLISHLRLALVLDVLKMLLHLWMNMSN